MLREKTITLNTPLKIGDIEHREITLREPTAGQMMKIQSYSGFEQNVRLIAEVAKIEPLVVQQMAFSDFKRCVDFFEEVFSADDAPAA